MASSIQGIGAVSRATGLSPQQIRYLERFGVLTPDRTAGGWRTYDTAHTALLSEVADAWRAGEPLASVARRIAGRIADGGGKSASAKIGELAAKAGVNEQRIRQLVELGILSALRTDGGTRLFHENDEALVRIAATLAETTSVGTLEQLATERQGHKTGRESSAQVKHLLVEIETAIDSRLAALREAKTDLAKAAKLIAACAQCPNRPNPRDCPDCPMERQRGASEIARIVWES